MTTPYEAPSDTALYTPPDSPTVAAMAAQQALGQTRLDVLKNEYEHLAETQKTLETKAQAGIPIAGLFVASAMAYGEFAANLNPMGRYVVIVVLMLLTASVLCSILALWPRKMPEPPYCSINRLISDMLRCPLSELPSLMPDYMNEQQYRWLEVIDYSRKINSQRGVCVIAGQVCLSAAIMLVAFIQITVLL